jgi:hypothetical protein
MGTESSSGAAWYEILSKITPLLLGVFITGGGIWATNHVQEAQLQLSQINSLFGFLPKMRSTDPAECVSAFEAFNGDGLEVLLINIVDRTKEPCGRPRLRAIAASNNREAKALAGKALHNLPIQVFMHIDSDAQAVAANHFAQAVDGYGAHEEIGPTFSYRGVAVVGNNSPAQPEIRYFVDSDRADAEQLAVLYRQSIEGPAPSVELKTMMAKPGTLEVWMPRLGTAASVGSSNDTASGPGLAAG